MNSSSVKSVSAPSTPTEQTKQLHSNPVKKKGKRPRVHFPVDEMLVTCYLDPPDPWSKVFSLSLDCVLTAYIAACDKQGIQPLLCVLDQLQDFQSHPEKLDTDCRTYDLSLVGEKLSVKHCEALEEILRRIKFQMIDLEGCSLEDEGAAALFDMIEYYDSAVHLNISFIKHIDCRGWQACSRMIKKTSALLHLNARSTGLSEQVLLILGRALRLGSNLITLHLENCGIFGRCLVILVAALKSNTTLRELFLAENKISSSDGFQLGNLLRTNTHLELLDLSNNKLEDDGLIHLMDSLGQQSNTSGRGLSTLILWNNELTNKGMPCVSRALNSARTLKRFNLGSNVITSTGIQELKQSFICNQTLETLELENCKITTEGAIALAEYIRENSFLQKLDIRGNDIALRGIKALSQSMVNHHSIVSLQVDHTSMDLNESMRDRLNEIQLMNKYCNRNKEAKRSKPAQDVQLSTLFNGIFSRVPLVPSNSGSHQKERRTETTDSEMNQSSVKSRFRVSPVCLDNEAKTVIHNSPQIENHGSQSMKMISAKLHKEFYGENGCSEVNSKTDTVSREPISSDMNFDSNVQNLSKDLVTSRVKWLTNIHETNTVKSSFPFSKINNDSRSLFSVHNMEKNFDEINTLNSDSAQSLAFPCIAVEMDSKSSIMNAAYASEKVANKMENAVNLCNIKKDSSSQLGMSIIADTENDNVFAPEKDQCLLFHPSIEEKKLSTTDVTIAEVPSWSKNRDDKLKDLVLFLPSSSSMDPLPTEQKERRLSSPAVPSAPQVIRKTHSIKCCKELESLDLRSSVPLSPTRLHESFSFPEPAEDDVSRKSQISMKSSHATYLVH